MSECLDKGISVGEKSNLYGEEIIIKNSKIGIAVKDSSTTKVKKYLANDVFKCGSVYRKKKEFIGGRLIIENNNCNINKYFVKTNSSLDIK